MKVVDVAVDDTKVFGGSNDGTIVGFAVGDDYRSNVKQYTGVLDNGQALPEWVKIDRATGQTLVQFPEWCKNLSRDCVSHREQKLLPRR